MTDSVLASSFRDPSGFVYRHDGRLYRQVNRAFADQYDLLMSSGLYEALTRDGLLIPHREADPSLAAARDDAYRVLEPEPVAFVSYPYEWSFSQLKAAALTTLRIQRAALEHGMSLRDASAYNVQFHRGRPLLIDTLSFERLPDGKPWIAYAQFCQHFLAPLALISYRDVRLAQLLRVHMDGVPLDLAASLLPFRARLRPALLLHLFLHARSQRTHAGEATEAGARSRGAADRPGAKPRRAFSLQAFKGLIDGLERAIAKMEWKPGRSVWGDYYAEAAHYSDAGLEHKRAIVEDYVREAQPATVWDLGANTGLFSRVAAAQGASVVSFDVEPACVDANAREVAAKAETNVLPLLMDLTNPSPSLGWANAERDALLERGPADMALALALIHHLVIGNNVPLPGVARFLHRTCTWLAIEFVPKDDPKVQTLLSSREDIFGDYTVEGFERAFEAEFSIERSEPIKDSDRVLYLMRGRG